MPLRPTRSLVVLGLVSLVLGGLTLRDAKGAPALSRTVSSSVAALQANLARLGYLPLQRASGTMDERTRQAVLAFQGWEGLARDGVVGPLTRALLATAHRPRPLAGAGARIEVHLGRQVALLVRGDRLVRAIHVSTGGPAAPTPTGSFRVYRKERNSWSVPYRVWLPWASYFTGGVALHGYPDVPPYPASHGCVRIPLSEAHTVYAFARLGVPVRVVG
jgi:lipoprotein-anchoring transpeptidase ErfK/SrfK